MEFAFRTSILSLTVLSASVAFGQQARPVTLTQFLGMSRSGSCNSSCCPAPCEPTCCPEPVCEPSCGCESHACNSCCKPPRQSLLSRLGLNMSSRSRCCNSCKPSKPCDPCGYDLWPCVGECCNSCPSPHGGYSA